MKRLTDLLLLLALLPAAVVPFVAFTEGLSPLKVTAENYRDCGLLAAPFFLGVPLPLWHLRRVLVARPRAKWERWLAYVFSGAAIASYLGFMAMLFSDLYHFMGIVLMGLSVAAICFSLLRWLLKRAPAEEIPSATFAVAYLMVVALPLLVFGYSPRRIGWWLTLLACAGLVVQLVIIARRAHVARQLAAAGQTPTEAIQHWLVPTSEILRDAMTPPPNPVVNVAGCRESKAPGIQVRVKVVMLAVLRSGR
jgi:hypothetical protein